MNSNKLIGLLFALLFIGCEKNLDLTNEKTRLLQADKEFAQASLENGAAGAFNMFLADDAMQFPEGADVVTGRETIYDKMKKGDDKYVLSWEPQKAAVSKSADMGWTWGKYILAYKDETGNEQKSYGKYVNIWQKQKDNSWKVIVDIGNGSPAPN